MPKTLIASLALVLLAWAAPVVAAPPTLVLDQEVPPDLAPPSTLAIGGASEQMLAQTVTAGVAGRLAEVWLPVGCASGKLFVEIRDVTPVGEPGVTVLKRRRVPANRLPETVSPVFQQFRFSPNLRLAAGDQFAIVLRNPTGSCGLWRGPTTDTYPDGRGFFDARPNPPGWLPLSPTPDLSFQTYMLIRP